MQHKWRDIARHDGRVAVVLNRIVLARNENACGVRYLRNVCNGIGGSSKETNLGKSIKRLDCYW